MPDTFTTNLNLDLPEVGADNDTWGGTLNTDLQIIDALFANTGEGTVIVRDTSNRGFATGFAIEQVAGNSRTLDFLSAALSSTAVATGLRWQAGVTNDAESGSNAGSNFAITAYSDTGTLLGQVLEVERSTQVANFPTTPTVDGTNNVWNDGNALARLYALVGGDASEIASLFPTTGEVKLSIATAAPAGWIMCQDQTIGPSASSANYNNDNCEALYTVLWNNVSNTNAPVTGGRGVSAAADWAAAKPMQLLKMLGLTIGISGTPSIGGAYGGWALGQTFGEETHVLASGEMPNHSHGFSATVAGSQTSQNFVASIGGPNLTFQAGGSFGYAFGSFTVNGGNFSVSGETGGAGSGAAHNNMQPTTRLNAMIKL